MGPDELRIEWDKTSCTGVGAEIFLWTSWILFLNLTISKFGCSLEGGVISLSCKSDIL